MAKTGRNKKRVSLPQRRRRKPDGQQDRRRTESALEAERRERREAEAARQRATSLMETLDRALAESEAARNQLTILAETTTILIASLDYEATLASIARLAVPRVADWCIVDLLDEQGVIRQVGVAHGDPAKESLVRELRRHYPPALNPQHVIMRVLSSGRAELTPRVTEADLRARAQDETHFTLLRSLGIHSHMVVPLIARGRTLGVISFIGGPSRRQYSTADLALAEGLAARAAIAIDNAHVFASERRARAETEDALRRVNATNRLVAMAASALDLGQVFDEFSEVLRTLVPFVRVTVSLYIPESETLTMPHFKGPQLTAPPEKLEGPKAGTARGWVIDHGKAFIRDDTYRSKQFVEDTVLAEAGIRSYVVVPMIVGGRVIGTLNFGHDVPGFYTHEHAQLSQPIADQLGLTISRFELFEQVKRRAGELSVALQRALLPAELPRLPFLDIAALYRAADPDARVGGDWYDALLLPDDRLLISLGDVAGHGVEAAAAMAQVRNLVQALAIQGRRPADVMAAVNHYLLQLPVPTHLSMWLAILDPITGELVYGGAGHPPVLIQNGGEIRELPSQSPPIGFSSSITYQEARAQLTAGERLIAYTDGLIEVTRDPLEGEQRLRNAVAATDGQSGERAVRILVAEALRGDKQEDDIAILLVDALPLSSPLSFAFRAAPDNLRRVRHAVRIYAERVGFPPRRVEEIVAAVGEAALNIVEHAYRGEAGEVAVGAWVRDGTLTVSVRDTGQWRPLLERGRGRGRRLMEGFADSVETVAGPAGTTVELRWALPKVEVTSE
jgi:serine phosphatase RsbU (regulator of sigma subunit)/anti-sigma regulatory factor (Ser/Thr protein kinase)